MFQNYLNIRPGVGYSPCEIEIEVPESQRQPGGYAQLRHMNFRPVMSELQFGRPQVAVDLLARPLQLEHETELGLAADARLQPKLLHLQHQRDPLPHEAAHIAKTPHKVPEA